MWPRKVWRRYRWGTQDVEGRARKGMHLHFFLRFSKISSVQTNLLYRSDADALLMNGGAVPGWNKGTSRMLPCAAARAIVRKLKLKSCKEWEAWRKAGQRPSNIQRVPR